jgi:hypothetical protein
MIEVKLSNVIDSMPVMQKLTGVSFKGKTAFQVARLLRDLDNEIKIFNETRINLVRKYGMKDENGELKVDENGNCSLEPENIETFNTELNELLNTTITLNVEPINIEDLSDGSFTPTDMLALEPFIQE